MKTSTLAGSLLAGLALLATPLQGQAVSGEVVVRGGPVTGRVVVGDEYSSYRQSRRVVVVERYAPRVIVVERMRHGHHGKHWRRHGYRRVVVYHVDGRYYDRDYPHRHGLQEVVVYEHGGRYYYLDDDHRGYRDGRENDYRNHDRDDEDRDD